VTVVWTVGFYSKITRFMGAVNLCLDLLVNVIEPDAFFKRSPRLTAEK
jgi:hypothetical protein